LGSLGLSVERAPLDLVDPTLAFWVLFSASALLTALMAFAIENQVEPPVATSEPEASSCLGNPLDDPMDVDPAPSRSPSPSALQGLPFPGRLVDGVHEVVHRGL
jgi:hypothetical protein